MMQTLASVKNFLSLQITGTRFEPWARGIWDIFNPLIQCENAIFWLPHNNLFLPQISH